MQSCAVYFRERLAQRSGTEDETTYVMSFRLLSRSNVIIFIV
jgi:hypothetical protein